MVLLPRASEWSWLFCLPPNRTYGAAQRSHATRRYSESTSKWSRQLTRRCVTGSTCRFRGSAVGKKHAGCAVHSQPIPLRAQRMTRTGKCTIQRTLAAGKRGSQLSRRPTRVKSKSLLSIPDDRAVEAFGCSPMRHDPNRYATDQSFTTPCRPLRCGPECNPARTPSGLRPSLRSRQGCTTKVLICANLDDAHRADPSSIARQAPRPAAVLFRYSNAASRA